MAHHLRNSRGLFFSEGALHVCPDTSKEPRFAFTTFLQEQRLDPTIKLMEAEGFETRAKRPYSSATVRGWLQSNKYVKAGLISQDDFNRVQELLKRNKNKGRRSEFALTSYVRCRCGALMHYRKAVEKWYSGSAKTDSDKCGCSICGAIVNKAVAEALPALGQPKVWKFKEDPDLCELIETRISLVTVHAVSREVYVDLK